MVAIEVVLSLLLAKVYPEYSFNGRGRFLGGVAVIMVGGSEIGEREKDLCRTKIVWA